MTMQGKANDYASLVQPSYMEKSVELAGWLGINSGAGTGSKPPGHYY